MPELRAPAPYYFDWLAHPPGGAWWDWADLRGRYGRVGAAVLGISGWHDEAYGPEGAMTNFLGLLEARRGERDPRAYVILGPWVHGGEGEDRAGDRVFGPQARLAYGQEIVRFMDRYVRGIENGVERGPRVRAFVMGENAWRTGETLPLPGTTPLSLYLGSGGMLGRVPPSDAKAASAFVSDPARPVVDPYADAAGAHDYRSLAGRPDTLVFQTEPLEEALRVVGAIETEIYLSADAPDADLWVKLEDVAPDGTAWNLSSPGTDVLRVSDRDGGASPKFLSAGRGRPHPPAEPAHRKPVREGAPRARRALRQLHASLFAQPPDGRVGDALGENPQGDDPHPPRRGPPLAHRAARRGVGPAAMTWGGA